MKLEHLLYTSDPVAAMSRSELIPLVEHAAAKNAEVSLTGILLYGGGHFMQLLEGPRERLDELFMTLWVDPRHRNLQVIERTPVGGRLFSQWNMGLLNVSEQQPLDAALLDQVRAKAEASPANTHRSLALLREFHRMFSKSAV